MMRSELAAVGFCFNFAGATGGRARPNGTQRAPGRKETKQKLTTMKKNFCMPAAAALCGAIALGMTACGGDDAPGGPGLDYGEKVVTGYRMDYNVSLADPDVHEVADVIVEFVGADGSISRDTMDGQMWHKTVSFPLATKVTYGLAARFAAKDAPTLTKEQYDFATDLTSHVYTTYNNASPMPLRSPKNHTGKGILLPLQDGSSNTVRSAGYLSSQAGREDIDTTSVSYYQTIERLQSGADTLLISTFPGI